MMVADRRPGKWIVVRTDAGSHVVLKGANGEIVLTSEVYESEYHIPNVLDLVRHTEALISEHEDQRTPKP